jgi:hypothetical protein
MLNPFKEVNWRPNRAEKRRFAVSLMVGFPCLALLFFVGHGLASHAWNPMRFLWLGGAGFGAGLLFWLLPAVALPFYLVWYFLSCCIGLVAGNLLLSLFFYTAITGIGSLLRLFGRPPLSKGFARGTASYWQDAEPAGTPERYYRQY